MAFDKFKQLGELNKMRQQAKVLQKQLEGITETVKEKDIEVKVSGDQKILFMKLDGEERQDIVDTINKAMKKVQKKAAKKMMEMGGGLSGLLGN
ncbi:MAG: YbaB/EbfC family nucleoid-associated protein [Patescibacteria group bacterium]